MIITLNEEKNIERQISFFSQDQKKGVEVIVVDGGSKDGTVAIAEKLPAKILRLDVKCRATQMNAGAEIARGEVLYFVHADVKPDQGYYEDIKLCMRQGHEAGCYRYRFDSRNILLKINAYMTRFDRLIVRGGDQTLFITRDLFDQFGGFDERYVVMEDFDLIRKLRKVDNFHIIPKSITVSARKYHKNNWFKVQLANLVAFTMFSINADPKSIRNTYYKMLN